MIRSSIKVHDKYSVVIDATYDKVLERKKSKYTCITYLFFPNTLNINNKTYPSTKFYNDVRLFIKYNRPNYSLSEIHINQSSPLKRLEKSTINFITNNSTKSRSLYEEQVKMFASIFCTLLEEQIDEIVNSEKLNYSTIEKLLNNIKQILKQFRSLVDKTANSSLKPNHMNYIFYADEHISNIVELQMMYLFNSLHNKISKEDYVPIVNIIDNEQKYKKHCGYSSPKDKSIDPEVLLYKRNQLKKYIDSVFFLNQETRQDGEIFEQTLLAIAAGLAMVLATGIAFYFQQYYGNFTAPFFFALVVSYMLKDRIKGLLSKYFVNKSSTFFYDFKINITDSLKKKIGLIKESFVFISFDKLGSNIKKYRLKDRILKTKLLNEQIIQYKKKVILFSKKFGGDLPNEDIAGLTDITRLNFHRFIQYMDDPEKDYILVKKGEIYTKIADKVYPINIIQKYFTEEGIECKRYRVIMNRNGIKRIEEIEIE